MKLNFEEEEKIRQDYVEKLKEFSKPTLDIEKWERIKRFLYKPRPLKIDVIIDDSTLREGLQMAKLTSPSPDDAYQIACMLRDIGVERIEVLTYTKPDQEAIKKIQDGGMGDLIAAWCRASIEDINLALKLDFKQIGISHPVSYIHFLKWPESSLEDIVERVVRAVEYAHEHGLRIFVHGEDSTRADWRFERSFINAVADSGAEVYRICDTVGCGSSDENAPLPFGIPAKLKHIKQETTIPYVEIHAHDDLGNAVENTMAAIRVAENLYDKIYVSTTFLGIGERAGNAETEKIIMNCYIHHDIRKWNLKPLRKLAVFLASSLNYHLPMNKAIVGDLAFSHESGIHLHGIETNPLTYELFPPELVGHRRSVIIGKRSGKHGIKLKSEQILKRKIEENDPRLNKLVHMIKEEYLSGRRRHYMKEEEFKVFMRKAGFSEV